MNNDLNRSVRLLEDALSVQGTSLLRKSLLKTRKDVGDVPNLSITLSPEELEYLQGDFTLRGSTFLHSIIDKNETLTGSVIRSNEPWRNAFDALYIEFLEIVQSHSSSQDVLETISELGRCCSDALNVVKSLKSKVSVRRQDPEEVWLENECNTWRLIYILYHDRLNVQYLKEDEDTEQYFGLSEKLCMLNLFKRDNLVRESQLVIDWLEHNASENDDEVLHFSDNTVGWENTLHQLQSKETIVFASSRDIVTSLHPDVPTFEKKPLHDLDEDDEKRLCRRVFTEIRCGKLEEAQKLCMHCGHSWRAAIMEGWKLHHDPSREIENGEADESGNVEMVSMDELETMEGNENRALWKLMALKYCKETKLDKHFRAAIAAYCGNVKEVLPVCKTWEDYLWAYMRVMVDIRVESEIRDCVNRTYQSLPEHYWEQRMSLNDIFSHLETSDNRSVLQESKKPEHVIQKYLILDDIPELFIAMNEFVHEEAPTQFLRFLSHLVLFLEQIGQAPQRTAVENILEAYIKRLMSMEDIQLVAFYVSKLGMHKQIELYSLFLEGITGDDERHQALKCAEECSLNVDKITRTVVENIRNKPFDIGDLTLQQKITPSDEYKISAIDWLLFYDIHRLEAILQANALIYKFLILQKLDAAQLVFNKIPSDSVDKIMSEDDVSAHTKQVIREYFSYRAYLDAHEAFNLWFKHFKSKPHEPEAIPENSHLTEKVAYQQRTAQFRAEMERWKMTTSHLAKSQRPKTLLYNVLLFPDGGWLTGAKDADQLRANCIPECTLLLYNVLFESGLHNECIRLSEILASDKYCLYKVYSKEKLREIVEKLAETSVALLNAKQDPWGNETSL